MNRTPSPGNRRVRRGSVEGRDVYDKRTTVRAGQKGLRRVHVESRRKGTGVVASVVLSREGLVRPQVRTGRPCRRPSHVTAGRGPGLVGPPTATQWSFETTGRVPTSLPVEVTLYPHIRGTGTTYHYHPSSPLLRPSLPDPETSWTCGVWS